MRLVRGKCKREGLAGPEKVLLPYDVLQRAGTQAVGQRRFRLALSEEALIFLHFSFTFDR
jgi:hypothetical protein